MSKFISALGFLTIIKIPGKYIKKKEQLAGSTIYFPLVGLLIGSFMALFYFTVSFILPVFLSIIMLLILEVFVTGGSHLDGLGDMFDGIFSGECERKKVLKIMAKSETGVYGVLAIFFLLLLKIFLLFYIKEINSSYLPLFFLTVMFMPAFSRWGMVYMIGRYENVRGKASLARVFTDSRDRRKNLYISSVYMTLLFLVSYVLIEYHYLDINSHNIIFTDGLAGIYLIFYFLFKAVLVIVVFSLLQLFTGWFFTRRIGGITGDIIGGVSEVAELIFLLIIFLVSNFL